MTENFYYEAMSSLYNMLREEINQRLVAFLIEQLNNKRFYFMTLHDFHQFVKKRVTKVAYADNKQFFDFYLDFIDAENKGTYLGSYHIETVSEWVEYSLQAKMQIRFIVRQDIEAIIPAQ